MAKYVLKASLLNQADRSDPFNQHIVVGIKLEKQPREIGDEIWGVKLTLKRNQVSRHHIAEEIILGAVIKFIVAYPIPDNVREMILQADLQVGAVLATDWSDITKGLVLPEFAV